MIGFQIFIVFALQNGSLGRLRITVFSSLFFSGVAVDSTIGVLRHMRQGRSRSLKFRFFKLLVQFSGVLSQALSEEIVERLTAGAACGTLHTTQTGEAGG